MTMRKFLQFFPVAEALAALSKDRSTKVGALALGEDHEILSAGYNGFPRGVADIEERHERPMKYLYTSHAEENLVAQAARKGISLKGSTILVTSLFPCTTCSRMMIQAGVKRIIANHPKIDKRWEEQATHALIMLVEAGVEVVYTDDITTPEDSESPSDAGSEGLCPRC
jgi:dCMP deaminase